MMTGRVLKMTDPWTSKYWEARITKENLESAIMFIRDVVSYSVELYAVEMGRYYL